MQQKTIIIGLLLVSTALLTGVTSLDWKSLEKKENVSTHRNTIDKATDSNTKELSNTPVTYKDDKESLKINIEVKESKIIANTTELKETLTETEDELLDEALLMETEEQSIVDAWDAENTPPDPSIENSEDWVDAPFAGEVNLINEDDYCGENCAESLNVQLHALNEFAEQVNPDDLRVQAIREGLIDPDERGYIPLKEKSDKAPPPLETGASVEPEE